MARKRTKAPARKPKQQSKPAKPGPRPRLTDAICKRLPAPATGNHVTYDGSVSGFGCRVTASGHKAFVLDYRTKAGRKRRYTIGDASTWSTTGARERAKQLKQLVDAGGDPQGDIEDEQAAPTVAELIERFREEHLPRLRESTAIDYRRMIECHIAPHFGKHSKVSDVTASDVERLHRKITKAGHSYRANAVVRLLSKLFSLSVRWAMRPDNPCKGLEKNREYERRRYLKPDELVALVKALAAHPSQQAADIVRMLMLTGARRGEVLGMRWSDVDLAIGLWSKLPSSTKQKEHHEVPLSAPARQLLAGIRDALIAKNRQLPEHVFPGGGSTEHITDIKRAWRSITKAARIEGLRLHDLRHSYASELVSSGSSLALIGALLGHASAETTRRYSHLHIDPLRAATERVGAVIAAAGKPVKEPTPIRRR